MESLVLKVYQVRDRIVPILGVGMELKVNSIRIELVDRAFSTARHPGLRQLKTERLDFDEIQDHTRTKSYRCIL